MSSCSAPAHPRAGGENWNHSTTTETAAGSSPRGRGKPVMSTTDSAVTVAHPRAGGENAGKTLDVLVAPGSSPRGRGKPCRRRVSRPVGGLIPARAGKTRPCSSRPRTCRAHPRAGGENTRPQWAHPDRGAHPRAGGENAAVGCGQPGACGSSPRGRGKRRRRPEGDSGGRLIPARAGKTDADCPAPG